MDTTAQLSVCIDRLKSGDDRAHDELIEIAQRRLKTLAEIMRRDFQGVARWEEADDVFQDAMIRLYAALKKVELNDSRHFLRLAAQQIRRQLIDLARKYQGPQGAGRHHHSQAGAREEDSQSPREFIDPAEDTHNPLDLLQWTEFHELAGRMPEDQREVFDLLWYQGLQQSEAADLLGVDVRTVRRRWRAARLHLDEQLYDESATHESP